MNEDEYKKEYLKAFGLGLKTIRTEVAKKSLRMFAYEAGVPHATLSRLENGTRIPNILTLKKISSSLNWQLPDLILAIEKSFPENIKNFEL